MESDESVVPESIVETLRRDPDVEFAVAFGSRVTGESRPSSDLDVAVKFSTEFSESERFRKLCRLSGRLQSDDAPFVDVSDIESLPVDVARAALEGTLICGDERALRAFGDDLPTDDGGDTEKRHREFVRRIAREGLRG